jgi:GTP cyclohydrolase FolE2
MRGVTESENTFINTNANGYKNKISSIIEAVKTPTSSQLAKVVKTEPAKPITQRAEANAAIIATEAALQALNERGRPESKKR